MQRRAEEDERKRREERDRPAIGPVEEEVPDDLVYVDELQMSAQERQQKRLFKKQDAYHLPDLPVGLSEMGGPDDPKVMSPEELEEYARQFHTGEDINIYDFSKIDFNSQFFISLPATDRYNILNAARLRSRLRMGYSKDQLDIMFPDRMAFSKFQIERVKERNELTQRLMNLNGMSGDDAIFNIDGGGRVAGERGKEYVLVKNDGVEGGWAFWVVSNKNEGERNKPIDVETFGKETAIENIEGDEWEEDGFEDVPIEGLNRLPNVQRIPLDQTLPRKSSDVDVLFEDVPLHDACEDDELQKAIAMSLEAFEDHSAKKVQEPADKACYVGPDIDKPLDFNRRNAKVGRDFAHQTNARAMGLGSLEKYRITNDKLSEDESMSLDNAGPVPTICPHLEASRVLALESINLGKSVFGKKKKSIVEEGGGFEKEPTTTEKRQQDLPPWFSAEATKEAKEWKDPGSGQSNQPDISGEESNLLHHARLHRHETGEVIDLDPAKAGVEEVIEVESSDNETNDDVIVGASVPVDSEMKMGDVADLTRAEPPKPHPMIYESPPRHGDHPVAIPPAKTSSQQESDSDELIEWEESDLENDGPKVPQQSTLPSLADGGSPGVAFPASPSASPHTEPSPIPTAVPTLPTEDTFDNMQLDDEAEIYSDPEEEDLMRQMAVEAEEHARFSATLNPQSHLQSAEEYEKELRQLRTQQKKDRRDADEVSQIMVTECQQLLKFFGLPYITAPMEAEAQCAELKFFSEFENLEFFSEWWGTVQLGQSASSIDTSSSFRKKFKKNAAKIFLPNGFPDRRVDDAYLHPEVDHDPSPFAWGVPDLDALRGFLMATIGWSQERTDEVLVPVVKDMNRRENEGTQANITQFFGGSVGVGANKPSADGAFAPRRRVEKSKRMTNALGRLHARAKDRTIGEDEGLSGDRESVTADGVSSGTSIHQNKTTQKTDNEAKNPRSNTKRKSRAPKKRPAQESPASELSKSDDEDDFAVTKRSRKGTKSKRSRKGVADDE
ncbi:succinate--CoA ligase [ADP-forming] subunit beta, hydrogenosomal [Physcia stellaris]|nr:succinate--CoA ligase [ADP-forming] subunit beta, hydrogenosomal [Physcia stellaris]